MNIEAKMIEDSTAPNGVRLTTLQLRYPRFIHAEFMTHRVFSRNASSSRAIPVEKIIRQVRQAPATPVHWGMNQPGMQANTELPDAIRSQARQLWFEAANSAAEFAEKLNALGLHKQVVNRIMEPFHHISVIVTSTEWENFFELRAHRDAQPEIQELALCIKRAMEQSVSTSISGNDRGKVESWHLPYVTQQEKASITDPFILAKLSAARCARVSYLTHDGARPSVELDLKLFERLVGAHPIHASPVEHQAYPLDSKLDWSRNFRGWHQFRVDVEANFKGSGALG